MIIDANYEERDTKRNGTQNPMDFAANIEKVKEVNSLHLNQKCQAQNSFLDHLFTVWMVLGTDLE